MTTMRPGIQLESGGQLRPVAGNWRVNPAQSYVTFAARAAGRSVRGRLPLTGRVLIAEPVEDSTAWLAARAGEVNTGSRMLDRELAGPSFLDAWAFPEISFRSELLAWVPTGQVTAARHLHPAFADAWPTLREWIEASIGAPVSPVKNES